MRRKGDLAEADLASAQAAFLRGDNKTARDLASRAKTRFAVGTPGWVKADDIVAAKPLPGQKNGSKFQLSRPEGSASRSDPELEPKVLMRTGTRRNSP